VSPETGEQVAAVTAEVLRSARYRWVAPDLVARLAAQSLAISPRPVDAIKRTKRHLHQVCGAFVRDVRPEATLADLRAALEQDGPAGLRAACRVALARHASTRERLPDLEAFYPAIFSHTGAPRSILDLACGLGPLAWPWMGLPPSIQYSAYDVDQRLVQLVDGFLTLLDVPHVVQLRDVVALPPRQPVDVALLLKGAPCLDQQAPGSARRLLEALSARHVALTYPNRSLGGAGKGMVAHYRAHLEGMLAGAGWEVATVPFSSETVYVLSRA
jgi:16S rRNA (guanine(1405)-N(7))-methyltransferase